VRILKECIDREVKALTCTFPWFVDIRQLTRFYRCVKPANLHRFRRVGVWRIEGGMLAGSKAQSLWLMLAHTGTL
jgi:hypothetical protein